MVQGYDLGPKLPGPYVDLFRGGIRQNAFTHEWNRGWTGNNGTSTANQLRIGRIVAPVRPQASQINRFFFHYNPQSVTIGTQVDPNVRPDYDLTANKVYSDVTATESMSFDFLLNRMYDVAFQQPTANDSAKAYGTLHDLYYLFGLINQNFGAATIKNLDYPNTDTGLIMPNPITVIFGELFRFVGVVQGLTIQHAKFIASPLSSKTSAPLIPVLTTVSMTLKRSPGTLIYADDNSGSGGPSDGGLGSDTVNSPGVVSSGSGGSVPGLPGDGSLPNNPITPGTGVPGPGGTVS